MNPRPIDQTENADLKRLLDDQQRHEKTERIEIVAASIFVLALLIGVGISRLVN